MAVKDHWIEIEKYLSTIDLLATGGHRIQQFRSTGILSTVDFGLNSFHVFFSSWLEVAKFWDLLKASKIQVHSIQLDRDAFERVVDVLSGNSKLSFQFSSEHRILCQFVFQNDEQLSSAVTLPVGGEVCLFKRQIPTFDEQNPTWVLGVQLNAQNVWMCRVACLGRNNIDIKAGSTKADILRVPISQGGSWSDLVPVDKNITNHLIYLVEFI